MVWDWVEKIIDSTLRNQDALLTLSSIRKVDEFTYMHSLSVATMMIVFCSSLYLKRNIITEVGTGALLHDIGKSKLPLELLNKAGHLSEEETAKMRDHVDLGCEVLSKTPGLTPISLSVAAEHHENYDGTGYPKGLKGEEISVYGQIAAIVDMYDNLTSDRGYSKGMSPTVALNRLLEVSGHQFNEELVQRFIRRIGIYPVGTLVKLDNGFLGVVLEQGARDLLNPVIRLIYDTEKKWFIKPRDLDLSNPKEETKDVKIVSPESPDKWKINPKTYLSQFVETSLLSRRLRASR
jgi:putative nucleotidyltransferase with HDIG domain